MRKLHYMCYFDFVGFAGSKAGRRPLADTIHSQNGGLVKRRWKKGACGVGFVVLGEDISAFILVTEGLVHFTRQMQLMTQPQRHTHQKLPETTWGITDIGFEQPLEFQQGLLIKNNIIELFGSELAGIKA